MFGASLEQSIINIKVIEKTRRRNLPILQEEETFRIFGKYIWFVELFYGSINTEIFHML